MKILRMRDVLEMVSVSRTTVWRQVKAGDSPAPIRLSPRSVGWRQSDIEEWIASRDDAVGVA